MCNSAVPFFSRRSFFAARSSHEGIALANPDSYESRGSGVGLCSPCLLQSDLLPILDCDGGACFCMGKAQVVVTFVQVPGLSQLSFRLSPPETSSITCTVCKVGWVQA